MDSFFTSVSESFEKLARDFKQAVDKIGSDYNRSTKVAQRAKTAKSCGIVSERDAGLTSFPEYVCELGERAKVVDISANRIGAIPDDIKHLTKTQKLNLSCNVIAAVPIALCVSLVNLKVLNLSRNKLRAVPTEIGSLTKLEELTLADNKINELPPTVSKLGKLTRLNLARNELEERSELDDQKKEDVSNPKNKISGLAYLGYCPNLQTLTLDGNPNIETLPTELGLCTKLTTLSCDDTKLKTIPNEILTGCVKLCNLSMKGTRVDVNLMRNTPGYDAFDERRVKSRNKQIAGNVLVGGLDDVVGENQKR